MQKFAQSKFAKVFNFYETRRERTASGGRVCVLQDGVLTWSLVYGESSRITLHIRTALTVMQPAARLTSLWCREVTVMCEL